MQSAQRALCVLQNGNTERPDGGLGLSEYILHPMWRAFMRYGQTET